DMPWWVNVPLSPALRAKVDRPGFIGTAGADPAGCADASLYRRFSAAGLPNLTFLPQLVAVTPVIWPARLSPFGSPMVGGLTIAPERPESLRVFGCLPVTARGAARRQASEKPRRRKPRGEYAPAAVSVYGDLRRGSARLGRSRTELLA